VLEDLRELLHVGLLISSHLALGDLVKVFILELKDLAEISDFDRGCPCLFREKADFTEIIIIFKVLYVGLGLSMQN
jgi:hypothetical protein